jgi:GNAT superfamily N-acetyltransferase
VTATFQIVPMAEPIEKVVALQALAFPPPFPSYQHWKARHLRSHITTFPEGQLMAVCGDQVIGSCSNCLIEEEVWTAHLDWMRTVGGPMLENHSPNGSTLYGLDITVHPDFRKIGVGRAFYEARFEFIRRKGLKRYGTACRLPDFKKSRVDSVEQYVRSVISGNVNDRTLTPLMRYGLTYLEVLPDYMDDPESGDSAALLEWKP